MRDYYKDIIFDIIKIYSNINYHNLYSITEEIIIEVNNIFEIYDKIVKSNMKFHIINFAIGVKNKKKSFKNFYIRFSVAIVLLDYLDIFKIFNLKRLINTRLRY